MDAIGPVVAKPSRARPRLSVWLERALICAVLAAQGWFYWWTVTGDGAPLYLGQKQDDYFNLLMHGFLSGHLYLQRPVSPALLAAENPYDPSKRPPNSAMHDVSFYRRHYYLYFGATPVVTLFLPFRLLTGMELPVKLAMWILACGGLLAGAAVWLGLRRRYYPASGPVVAVLGLLILGVVSLVPALLRRPSFWELPITSGYCCLMLALACVSAALHSRRPAWGLAGAALCLGLAVGSRPTYVFGCVLLAGPLGWLWWRGRREGRWRWWPGRAWWWPAAAAAAPLGLVGAALALYNYLRFGNPLEFGLRYQLTGNYEMMIKHFQLSFVPFNAYLYFWAPAQWGRYFPFVHFIHPPVPPGGYYGWEYVWGVGVNLPILWLALLAPAASWRRGGDDGGRLTALGLTVGLAFAAEAGILLCFNTAALRYMADFVPALALAAGLGLLAAERWLGSVRRPAVRLAARLGWVGAAGLSIFVAVMISVQVHELLAQLNPRQYRRLASWCDLVPSWFERMAGTKYGPLEMTVWFSKETRGIEPLLATGWEFASDRLLVEYLNDHEVRLLFDHTSRGAKVSPAIPIDYRVPHVLRVEMGSLFPPPSHPLFRGMNNFEVGMLTRWLRVSLDGQVAFDFSQPFYDASPESLRLGVDPIIRPNEPGAHFSGEFLSVRRVPFERLHDAVDAPGSLLMKVRFQRIRPGAVEPLLSVGAEGSGAVVYARYLDAGRAVFGLDQWGWGATEGPPVPLDETRDHEVEIRLASLYPPADFPERQALLDRAMLRYDGRLVFNRVIEAPKIRPGDIWIGMNRVGCNACETQFSGAIMQLRRVMEGPAHPATAGAVRMDLCLPAERTGANDPLVTTGRTGAGDFLIVCYRDAQTIQFAHDHWGAPLDLSPPVTIDYAVPHVVEVDMGSLHPGTPPTAPTARGAVEVKVDGRPVWVSSGQFYSATPGEVWFGHNPIGGSNCERYFRGAILSIERGGAPADGSADASAAGR